MTDLEQKVHDIDNRQNSFETFMKLYVQKNDEQMKQHREDIKNLDEKIDRINDRLSNLITATALGVAAIVIAVVLSR